MSKAIPSPPRGLRTGGKRLWRSVLGRFELEEAESAVLTQACRTRDVLDQLDEDLRANGLLDFGGAPRRVAIEQRMQSLTLARLLGSLRLPDDDDVRAQRRVTSRGTYQSRRRAWRDAQQQARLGVVP